MNNRILSKVAAITLTAAVMALSLSCNKDEKGTTLSIDPLVTEIVFSSDGTSATSGGSPIDPTFTLVSNKNVWDLVWDAVSDQTWLSVSKFGVEFTLSAEQATNVPRTAKVTVTADGAPPVTINVSQTPYAFSISQTGSHNFGEEREGYAIGYDVTPLTVTLTNSTTGAMSFEIAIVGANANAFEVSTTGIANLAGGASETFTVSPAADLDIGIFAATVTVKDNFDDVATFDVNFRVNAAEAVMPDISWYNESGTTFQISTANQLAGLAELVNDGKTFSGKTVVLQNNISLAGYGEIWHEEGWIPIGNPSNGFEGTFDGGGNVVRRMYINRASVTQGLFGRVSGGTIKNLGVADASIVAGNSTTYGRNSGIVVGHLDGGSIEGCWSSGSITNYTGWVGGLVGLIDADAASKVYVSNCHSSADVISFDAGSHPSDRVGGLVGFFRDDDLLLVDGNVGIMRNCYTTGTVTREAVAGDGRAGGIIGNAVRLRIEGCYSTATVKNDRRFTGGIAGRAQGGTIIINCYFAGTVTGIRSVGGIAGELIADVSEIINCYVTGEINGDFGVVGDGGIGGIVGDIYEASSVKNSAALNISIKGTGGTGEVNRIAGILGEGCTLSDNVAFSGITNDAGTTAWSETTASGRSGESKTANEINAASFFQGVFTGNVSVWTFEAGKLPGFGAAVEMPEYLK